MASSLGTVGVVIRSSVRAASNKPILCHSIAPTRMSSKVPFLTSNSNLLLRSSVRTMMAYIDDRDGSVRGSAGGSIPEPFKQALAKLQNLASCTPPNDKLLNDLLTLASKYEADESRMTGAIKGQTEQHGTNQFSTVDSPYPNYVTAQLNGSATD